MIKAIYRVIVSIGYCKAAFEFETATAAGDFAKMILLHHVPTNDENGDMSVGMEVYLQEPEEPKKHDGCLGCLHMDKKEDEYPCCYCKGTRTDRYQKKED